MDDYGVMVMARMNDKLLWVIYCKQLSGETDKVMNFTITGSYFAKYVAVFLEHKADELIIMHDFRPQTIAWLYYRLVSN
jgi:hypothetical protein